MPKYYYFGVLFMWLCWQGCSGIQVSHDYPADKEYATLKTYTWQTEHQEETGDLRLDNTLRNTRIRAAVDRFLGEKGYWRVTVVPPDFYVGYQQKIHSRIDSDRGGARFAFGIGSFGSHGGFGLSTGNRVSDYDELMLVIEFYDSGNKNLIWRGSGTRIFVPHAEPEKIIKRINEIVQKILAQFPPQ